MAETDRVLKPANENPWYVLMTLYGEQDGGDGAWQFHVKNRVAWNAWSCQSVAVEQLKEICAEAALELTDLQRWPELKQSIMDRHREQMIERNGPDFVYPGFPDSQADIDFSYTEFDHQLSMVNLVFDRKITFEKSLFQELVNSDQAFFLKLAIFSSVTFNKNAIFSRSTFCFGANFSSAIFEGVSRFKRSRFITNTRFAYAEFKGESDFAPANFVKGAEFTQAKFYVIAYFSGATFGEVNFSDVIFLDRAYFHMATFKSELKFHSVIVKKLAYFREAKFESGLSFTEVNFEGVCDFSKCHFGSENKVSKILFDNCWFMKPSNFIGARFYHNYPNFHTTLMHEQSYFTAKDHLWPKFDAKQIADVSKQENAESPAEEAKGSFAKIRHAVGKQGLPEEEHFFFRREMGFAGQSGPWWQRPPYWVFGWVSDYGYSILTPFLWLWLLIVGGGSVLAYGLSGPQQAVTFVQGLGLSFANVFNFLAFHKTFVTESLMKNMSQGLIAFSGFQSIMGVVLLFFLGLGLRTRFRLR
jgi:uncharacterized protein YjbI with pentapeptide repeats